ncbi:MAG TPA: phenylalanine--tRNA ligase subunit alpha [Actinomycetota bacterium]
MRDALIEIQEERDKALASIESADSLAALNEIRVRVLGRKARLARIQAGLGSVGVEDRKIVGQELNAAKEQLRKAFARKERSIGQAERAAAIEADRVDVTLPGRRRHRGHPHPISMVVERIVAVFVGMGYRVADGPEAETDWYNFQALNIPPHHPARSTQDSMFIDGTDLLLRTQTSSVQIRAMQKQDPPIYVVAPGRVHRRDEVDASHTSTFTQIEGLAVDKGISMAHLRGTLATFAREILGPDQRVRMRPSYFPFTEPSAELDVLCVRCGGEGCPACKGTGWMEVLGCGMVHPNVLRTVGYDPKVWSGFAFGMGPERIAMLALGIPDIRLLYENDQRFLAGFAG